MDWRFLLPARPDGGFEHLILLGGSRSLSDAALAIGLARRVSRDVSRSDRADALVVLHDASEEFSKAARCVLPGGPVYWEIERRWTAFPRTTPGAIRRRLLDHGLAPVALYWPRPSFEHPAAYLPIGPPGVLPWYVRTRLDPHNLRRRAAKTLLRALVARGGAWVSGAMPRYAATAIAGTAVAGAFGVASAIPGEGIEGGRSVPLMLLRGSGASRRVIQFPFSREIRDPAAAVKFWRLPDRNRNTEAEQTTLRRIRSRLDAAMAKTVPEPLGTIPWAEILAGVESYAPGPALSQSIASRGRTLRKKIEDVQRVFDWIGGFHRQAQVVSKGWDPGDLQRWIEEPLAVFRSGVEDARGYEHLFAAVRRRARALIGRPLPIVWAHPDLTGANIHLRSGNSIAVIDWSGAAPRLPLYDLLYFVMLWAAGVEGRRDLDARLRRFRRIVSPKESADAVTVAIREGIRRYLTELGICGGFFPLLATMAWVSRSIECFERDRAVQRREPGANPHPGESYVEYLQVLGQEIETVFSDSAGNWWDESSAGENGQRPRDRFEGTGSPT